MSTALRSGIFVKSEKDTGRIGIGVPLLFAPTRESLRAQLLLLVLPMLLEPQFLKPDARMKLRLFASRGLFLSIAALIFLPSKRLGVVISPTVPKNGVEPVPSVCTNSTHILPNVELFAPSVCTIIENAGLLVFWPERSKSIPHPY